MYDFSPVLDYIRAPVNRDSLGTRLCSRTRGHETRLSKLDIIEFDGSPEYYPLLQKAG